MEKIEVKITLDPETLDVSLEANTMDHIVVLGMIETAKDAVHELRKGKDKSQTERRVFPISRVLS